MPHLSTFSIAACDLETPAWGVAVASKFLAVGAVVPWVSAGAGAVATQSFANTAYGPQALEMMRQGLSASETLKRITQADPERALRQVGLVDVCGEAATFTGEGCFEWAGGLTGPGYAIQGNILAGAGVVQAMEQAFLQTQGALAGRLYAALLAGDRAGGDRRGRQSAALYVAKPAGGYGGYNDRWLDLRVDDHTDPVQRLGELLRLQALYFGHSTEEERVPLAGETLRKLQGLVARLGYYQGEAHGVLDAATRAALEAFLGNENFEERVDWDMGKIDAPVIAYLSQKFELEKQE
jgi:uncharacterized Ntn-hydrolase superfamily protein